MTKLRFNFNKDKVYKPWLITDYIIKVNNHPKKGKLIDFYTSLPNPYYAKELYSEDKIYTYNSDKLYTRVFVGRHWPKIVNDDHMLILLSYKINKSEKYFKGERLTHPIGNWTFIERGKCYLLWYYRLGQRFIYIIFLRRFFGSIPSIRGSVYAIVLDIDENSSTFAIKNWHSDSIYFRNYRIFTGNPKLDLDKEKIEIPSSVAVKLF